MAHDQSIKDEFGNINPDVRVPPLIKALSLLVEMEEEEESLNETQDSKVNEANVAAANSTLIKAEEPSAEVDIANAQEINEKHSEQAEQAPNTTNSNSTEHTERTDAARGDEKKEEKIPHSNRATPDIKIRSGEATPKKLITKTKINVPAAWTPANKRAQAALIYLYFRHVRNARFLKIL